MICYLFLLLILLWWCWDSKQPACHHQSPAPHSTLLASKTYLCTSLACLAVLQHCCSSWQQYTQDKADWSYLLLWKGDKCPVYSWTQSWSMMNGLITLLLWKGDKCPDIAHTDDKESDGLEKEEYVVVVIPQCDVIASTKEEVSCHSKLQNMQPDSTTKISHKNK